MVSNASSVVSGYKFQECASIVLFLDNIENIDKIRVEGKTEDIELYLSNGNCIYAQAKSTQSDDYNHVARTYFKDALRTLSQSDSDNVISLVYVTNIVRPFGKNTPIEDFDSTDHWIQYSDLSMESKTIIGDILLECGYSIDVNKLAFRIIGFKGNPERTRKEVILNNISRFVSKLSLDNNIDIDSIFTVWIELVNSNASSTDLSVTVSKKSIIWLFT